MTAACVLWGVKWAAVPGESADLKEGFAASEIETALRRVLQSRPFLHSRQLQLLAYRADGTGPAETLAVTLPPLGRKEIIVGKTFHNPAEIAYLVLVSDSDFISGYTRFSQAANRVSLPMSGGTLQGWFPKMEKNGGWTGLIFVNIGPLRRTSH